MNTNKVFDKNQPLLSNQNIAIIMLVKEVGEILSNKESHPEDIFSISYDYLFNGCNSEEDYNRLVNYCIKDENIRRDLKWYF